jgi:hypothetical protein
MGTQRGMHWVPNANQISPRLSVLQLYLGLSVIKPTVLFHGPAVVKVTVAVIVVIGGASPPG